MPEGRFRRAFVMGAYVPNGGTYMAYHLGKILHEEFGLTAFAVSVGGEKSDNGVQHYDLEMPSVSIDEMSATITDRDVLIINPSFSPFLLAWKVPGFNMRGAPNASLQFTDTLLGSTPAIAIYSSADPAHGLLLLNPTETITQLQNHTTFDGNHALITAAT
jgi:hypothetical protein